ncbi:MAG TPA: hypothetical protein VFZ64_10960 [Nocardioidaceae bacterium]
MDELTRRTFIRTGAAAALTTSAGAWNIPAAQAAARGPYVPYRRRSYFKSEVAGLRIRRTRTRAFRRFMRTYADQRDTPHPVINGIGGNQWGTPFAVGRASHPVWRLTGDLHPKARRLAERGFHAPAWIGSMLTGTSDSPLCVMDRAWGFTMFCTNAEVVGHRLIRANAGSITYHSSNGLDFRNRRSDDDRNFTSRGRISDAMVIRRSLVRHGIKHGTDLGHVLHLFLAETRTADGHRHPMVGEESDNYGFGAQGERLAIAPWVDLSKRNLSPGGLVIARTLQNHGCYIGDNSGSASCFKAEQETDDRPLWDGLLGRNALKGITWDDFVVLGRRR